MPERPFPPDERAAEDGWVPQTGGGVRSRLPMRAIAWPTLLSLTVLAVIGYLTFDLQGFQQSLRELNPWFLAAAVATVAGRVGFGGWRLHYIFQGRLGIGDSMRGQLAWDFFSNVTPSAIGGGPFAAVYIARDPKIEVGEATAFLLFSILLDQVLFAITIPIVLVASFYMEVIPVSLGSVGATAFMLYFISMLIWVVIFGYSTLFRPDILERLTNWIFRVRFLQRYRQRVQHEMGQLRRSARILRSRRAGFYLKGLLLTCGLWASRYLLVLFIVWSVEPVFDKLLLLLRTAAMTLGTFILPTPGGSGGIEGLYALFIGPFVDKAALAPTLLVWRFLGYYLFIALGIYLSTYHVQRVMRNRRRDRNAQTAPDAVRRAEGPAVEDRAMSPGDRR